MIQFVSPDDEHDVLETCRVINRNKCIEKILCITLVIYQEHYMMHGQQNVKYCLSVKRQLNVKVVLTISGYNCCYREHSKMTAFCDMTPYSLAGSYQNRPGNFP